jgi:signal peptidase I
MDESYQYGVMFGIAGLIIGAIYGYWKSAQRESRDALMVDNLEWADTGFSAILLASVVMFFVVQAFKIPSGSMRVTFLEGDHLFVNKFVYGLPIPLTEKKVMPLRHVQPGDIVIFKFPAPNKESEHYGKDFIKRCVALEGQEVKVINKKVFVDGVERVEPFAQHVEDITYPGIEGLPRDQYQHAWETGEFARFAGNDVRDNFGPITVPKGCIFVMGDNRDRSFDSRFWGPLKVSAIKGKAWLLYWPFSRFRLIR